MSNDVVTKESSDPSRIRFDAAMITLADYDVDHVYIGFEGSGDSGDVERPIFYDKDDNVLEMDGLNNKFAIEETILEVVRGKLLDQAGNWWDNDGGYGHVTIDVKTGEYEVEAHIRVVNTEDSEYQGNVSDFIEEDI